MEVPEGTGGCIFTLAMAAWRINFRGTVLETAIMFRRTREDEDSNQNGSDENRGRGMRSRNI